MCRPSWHRPSILHEPVIHPFYEWVVDAPFRDDVDEMSLDELRAEVRRLRSAEAMRASEAGLRALDFVHIQEEVEDER
jgi:hypothetical protein